MRPPRAHLRVACLALLLGVWAPRAAAQVEGEAGSGGAERPDAVAEEENPSAAPAAERPGAERVRVAVLIVTTTDLDPTMADGLTELLIGAVAARGHMTIVGKEEFQAQLGQGDEGTLECISSMACMGRVGVQLDVSEVIAGTLARRAERWIFNLNRVDVRSGEMLGRVFREVEGGLGAVADALNDSIPELYAAPPPPPEPAPPAPAPPERGTLSLRVGVAGAEVFVDDLLVGRSSPAGGLRREVEAGPRRLRVEAPGYRRWVRRVRVPAGRELALEVALEEAYRESLHPWLFIGAGLAVVAAGLGIGLGVASGGTLEFTTDELARGELTRAELLGFYQAREREAVAADVLFGLSGALAISAAVMLAFPSRERVEGVALAPSPGGLGVRGRF